MNDLACPEPPGARVVHVSTFHKAADMRIFHKECRSLAEAGFEVLWLAPAPAPPELGAVGFQEIANCYYPYGLGKLLSSSFAAWRAARAARAELYHFHDTLLIPVGTLLRLGGARVVFDVHEDAVPQALSLGRDVGKPWLGLLLAAGRFGLESLARLCWHRFVAVTPHIAAKFPHKRTILARNFPLRSEIAALMAVTTPYEERENQVLYVGNVTGIRGALEMVEAAARLPAALGARLVVAGEIPDAALAARLEALSGWSQVEYLGYQQRPGVIAALGRAKVGLAVLHPRPNYQLAYPVKLFEYMAAGLPVVASDFPLWREIVEGAGCGLLVDPLDPEAIAQAIRHLLENPRDAEAMGLRGRQAVTERYNWDHEAKELVNMYRELGLRPRGG